MKRKLFLICYFWHIATTLAQLQLLSWNIENLGSSKSESELDFITQTIQQADIVALQEVVAGHGGAPTVAALAERLNRKGTKWDYVVSDPTTGSSYKTERYAYLWKTAIVQQSGKPWLDKNYALQIDREPYFATFIYQQKSITLVNFHVITQSKQPEKEIKYFKNFPSLYPKLNLVFLGDFNCPPTHTVFNPLHNKGYQPALADQKTSLKKTCIDDDCLSKPFDNLWYKAIKCKVIKADVIHFYRSFSTLEEARKISDHLPITVQLVIL